MEHIDARDDNFHQLIDTDYAIVDCYGDHCGPCKILAPIFEEISTEMDFIKFIKFNVEHNPEVTQEYQLYSIPTLMFIRNGKIIESTTGVLNKEKFREHIAKLLYN
jgi:thioredoxin